MNLEEKGDGAVAEEAGEVERHFVDGVDGGMPGF